MRFLLFLTIQLIALISLSTQIEKFTFEEEYKFPIRAVSVLRGEVKDPATHVIRPISGVVRFLQESKSSNVIVSADIKGLPEHSGIEVVRRGFHIHEYAISDASENVTAVCGSAGAHYNPTNETHGYLNAEVRHIGDLGNLITTENGTIFENLVDNRLSLFGKHSIIGRTVVLHENEDDGGLKDTPLSHTVGSSGARIACGVIGYEKSPINSVQRSLFAIISGKVLGFEDAPARQVDAALNDTYLAFEDGQNSTNTYLGFEDGQNSTNIFLGFEDSGSDNTDDSDIMKELEDFSKTIPQTREVFKLFYRILKNMLQQAQDAESPLTKTLTQFQIPTESEIRLSVIPKTASLVGDNSTTLDPNVETIDLV